MISLDISTLTRKGIRKSNRDMEGDKTKEIKNFKELKFFRTKAEERFSITLYFSLDIIRIYASN